MGMKAKDICEIIAELFGSPCDYSPMDEVMLENEQCEKVCGYDENANCWYRYFQYEIKRRKENGSIER